MNGPTQTETACRLLAGRVGGMGAAAELAGVAREKLHHAFAGRRSLTPAECVGLHHAIGGDLEQVVEDLGDTVARVVLATWRAGARATLADALGRAEVAS